MNKKLHSLYRINIGDYTESDLVNALVNLTELEFQNSNKTIATPANSATSLSASATNSQSISTNNITNQATVNAGKVNTIVQLSRTGPVKRLKDIIGSTNETGGKRTRLDTELVKLVQTMTSNANSSAKSGSDNTSLQQMILQLHNQTQQTLMNFQQQQQLQQEVV
jgi:hypothetical protein